MADREVFATVGTTHFDKFIKALTTSTVLKILRKNGYKRLTLQIGNGTFIPPMGLHEGIVISYYRLKNSIAEDIKSSSLILSHAGAGSCIEALEAKKPLIVVINEDLMDNHQLELAQQLSNEGYLHYCTCSDLANTLDKTNLKNLTPYQKGNPEKFTTYLNKVMGFAH